MTNIPRNPNNQKSQQNFQNNHLKQELRGNSGFRGNQDRIFDSRPRNMPHNGFGGFNNSEAHGQGYRPGHGQGNNASIVFNSGGIGQIGSGNPGSLSTFGGGYDSNNPNNSNNINNSSGSNNTNGLDGHSGDHRDYRTNSKNFRDRNSSGTFWGDSFRDRSKQSVHNPSSQGIMNRSQDSQQGLNQGSQGTQGAQGSQGSQGSSQGLQQHQNATSNISYFNLNNIIPLKNKFNMKTSLFISNIPESVSNEHIQTILEQIGVVMTWNRLKDMNTERWKQSGLVVYKESAGACRALRLLRKVTLCGQSLKITCEDKTKDRLRRYKEQKLKDFSRMKHWRQNDRITEKDVDDFFEMQQDEDQGIEEMINELVDRINRSQDTIPQSTQLAVESSVDRFLMGGSREETEEKKSMLSHEIRKFRQMEKERTEGVLQREKLRQMEREKHEKEILDLAHDKENRRIEEEKRQEERMKRYREKNLSNLINKEKQREETLKRKREEDDDGMILAEKKRLMINEKKYYYKEVEVFEKIESRDISSEKQILNSQTDSQANEVKKDASNNIIKSNPSHEVLSKNEDSKSIHSIQNLPSDLESLFEITPNWDIVLSLDVLERLKQFIIQTVIDLLGQPEDILIDFIMSLLELRYTAKAIISEIQEVISDDTESFFSKIWKELLRLEDEAQNQS